MSTQYEITKEEAVSKLNAKIEVCERLTHEPRYFIRDRSETVVGEYVHIACTDGVDVNFDSYSDSEFGCSYYMGGLFDLPLGSTLLKLKDEAKRLDLCDVKNLFVDSSYMDFISKPIEPVSVKNWEQITKKELVEIKSAMVDRADKKRQKRTDELKEIHGKVRSRREKEDRNLFLGICLIMGAIPFSVLIMAIFG